MVASAAQHLGAAPDVARPSSAEQRLRELGLTLPPPVEPLGSYAEAVQTGNLLFLSGVLPVADGAARFTGRLGGDLDVEAARAAAHRGATAPRIARQGDACRQAQRLCGDIWRRTRSAQGRRGRIGGAAGCLWEREKSLPLRLRRHEFATRRTRRTGSHFRGGAVTGANAMCASLA